MLPASPVVVDAWLMHEVEYDHLLGTKAIGRRMRREEVAMFLLKALSCLLVGFVG